MVSDSEYMTKREQNYMFAYNVVPSLIYQGEFAQLLVTGTYAFKNPWQTLFSLLPREQRVSENDVYEDNLIEEKYQLADGVYGLLLRLPPAERYLEVQFIAIVFQPKLRCFAVGRSGLEADSKDWSVREITPEGHGKCGHLRNVNAQSFLEEVNRILGLATKIRLVDSAEFAAQQAHVETFAEEPHKLFEVLMVAATYGYISHLNGSTAGLLPAQVAKFLNSSSDEVRRGIRGYIFYVLDIEDPENEPNAANA